jgi:hypothetical protein
VKKFLLVVLLIVLVVAAGIAYVAVRGTALDKEAQTYADTAIPAIVTTWNEKELLERASPEFKKAASQQQLDQMFHWFGSLGRFQKIEPAQGHALMSATTQSGKQVTAQYTAKATFEKGEAVIRLGLIKHGDQWQILGFRVDSPALVPRS